MRHQFEGNCGRPKQIVHPTRYNCVECCTESVVEHIHPTHTTVMNRHLERNRHVFPHSTSVQNSMNCVDEFGGAFQTPPKQQGPTFGHGNQVAGAMDFNCEGQGHCGTNMNEKWGHHHHNHHPSHQHHHPHHHHHHKEMNNWKHHNHWC
ncbi:CotD family spore coat protein [Lentibacillus sp. N15]|uniref:CotD family spore coat protein n=1 Tax=Lentibacillus songyuanensis TaxID=3136161 RepID=UPI0031BAF197